MPRFARRLRRRPRSRPPARLPRRAASDGAGDGAGPPAPRTLGGTAFSRSVRNSIQTALLGAPDPAPGDRAGLQQLGDSVAGAVTGTVNATQSSVSAALAGVGAGVSSGASSTWSSIGAAFTGVAAGLGSAWAMLASRAYGLYSSVLGARPEAAAAAGDPASSAAGREEGQAALLAEEPGGPGAAPAEVLAIAAPPPEGTSSDAAVAAVDSIVLLQEAATAETAAAGSPSATVPGAPSVTGEVTSTLPDVSPTAPVEQPELPSTPWGSAPDVLQGGPCDFFLFIKDYSWSLRYRVSLLSKELLDTEVPLQLEWVRLRKPVSSPAELFDGSGAELFDWSVREPPRHQGFMYSVIEVVGSGVEAVINFFKGKGPNLMVQPEGISLATRKPREGEEAESEAEEQCHVTHCWVECMGLPFLPIVQSIAFFNLKEVVMDWRA